ncbi:MAG TPA: prenyltransferase/squalene oxidase repeat-containing protein [Streptosporangiaceae bacterium]|nr:prenyltransferase/squalene oxidase repeat-containing protein [Streptosporangiaceae bacterium]
MRTASSLAALAAAVTLLTSLPPGQATAATAATAKPSPVLPTCTPRPVIDKMVAYIRTVQAADGSFPSPFVGVRDSTADAVLALAGAGVDPSRVTANGRSAIDWIYGQTADLTPGDAAKFVLALRAARRSTVTPGGFDFVAHVRAAYDPASGLYDTNLHGNAYALVALRAVGGPLPRRALDAWERLQQADGGWSAYLPVRESDTNTTAVAVIGLVLNRRPHHIPRALAYLRSQQSADGGFTFSTVFGTDSDANSTGLTILALLAARQRLGDWERGGADPVRRLLRFQNPSGAFRFTDAASADDPYATFQAGTAAAATQCH